MNDYEIHVELDRYSSEVEENTLGWKMSVIGDYEPSTAYVFNTYILTAHVSSEEKAHKKLAALSKKLGPIITRKKIEHIIFDERIK